MKKTVSRFLLIASIFFFGMTQISFAESYPELCAVFNRTLKPGDTGQDVKRLQVVLGQEGIAYLASTGYFGPATERAVKVFQQRNGIYPAGKVGPQTFRFMKNLWCFGLGQNGTGVDGTYIPINTNNPELPPTGWNNGGSNWNNSSVPDVSIQPVSSQNNSVTISWNTRAVNSCTIQKDNENFQSVQSVGQQIFNLYGESRFTLKCIGFNGREYSKQIIVRPNQTISNLPWVNVSITPAQVLVGQQATLYWTSQNTSYCTSNIPGYNSNLQSSGSIPVTINSGLNSFTFTCYNQSGQSVSQTITTNNTQVSAPVINNFTYSNNYLAWGTANTNSCILSGGNLGSVTVPVNGNYSVPAPTTNTTWTLMCYGSNNQSVTRQVNYNVYTTCQQNNTCTTGSAPTVSVTPKTSTITAGQNVSLNLLTTNVTSCYINGGIYSNALFGGNNNGNLNVQPTVTTTYTFMCTGTNGQTVSQQVIVNVNNSTNTGSLTLTSNPSSAVSGQNITLTVTGTNMSVVSGCTLNGGNYNNTNIPVQGTVTSGNGSVIGFTGTTSVVQNISTTYTVTCINSTSGQALTANIFVPISGTTTNIPIVNLYANPTNTTSVNQPVTLTWSSTNATYCNISGGSTNLYNQSTSGTTTVYPTANTNYLVTCYASNGQSSSANSTINVNNNSTQVPTVNISASPTNTTYSGQPVTVTWNSTNASLCNVAGGNFNLSNQSTSGIRTDFPTTSTNYDIACYNSTGQSAASTVRVIVMGGGAGTPTVNISASPNPISSGQIANLTWYSSGANYCNLSGGNLNLSNQSTSGSYAVSPAISTNYTITCYNNNGQNASAYVYVTTNNNSTSLPIISSFYSSVSQVQKYGGYVLYWNTSNTTYCTLSLSGTNVSNVQASGSSNVTASGSTGQNTNTLTCYNQSGQSTSQSINVNVY